MSKICTHVNENTCKRCKPRPEKCWQLVCSPMKGYYLTEFYTGKTKKIPEKYFTQISKLIRDKSKFNSRVCSCEMILQNIIKKVLKGKKKCIHQN